MVMIYFAGGGVGRTKRNELFLKYGINKLISFYEINKRYIRNPILIRKDMDLHKKLFVDSGAYSFFSKGIRVDLKKYAKWCLKGDADYYANLDVIGDAEKTLENQKYMESQGCHPIPCYHIGEDMKYLDYYCENYDYVALGGMINTTIQKAEKILNVIFTKYPNQKFHGFSMTSVRLIQQYPWHSVDSTSWLVGEIYGRLFSFNLKTTQHYQELTDEFKEEIKRLGLTMEEILNDYLKRDEFNIINFILMEKNSQDVKFKNQVTFIDDDDIW
jgi:hypothetical protein